METKKDGGSAFPLTVEQSENITHFHTDMTLRDYFAAKAMQGMIANSVNNFENVEILSEFSYKLANAMLKERDK